MKDVLCATGDGNDRFYVMALTDFNSGTSSRYWWYLNAYDVGMSDYATATSVDFGTGRANTQTMIEKWNNKAYGNQSEGDMWGPIQEQVNSGWFVPSRGEWSAFAEELGITESNYENKNLRFWYWSSSQWGNANAWMPSFYEGFMSSGILDMNSACVRLSMTF